jgi:hypothetical protein
VFCSSEPACVSDGNPEGGDRFFTWLRAAAWRHDSAAPALAGETPNLSVLRLPSHLLSGLALAVSLPDGSLRLVGILRDDDSAVVFFEHFA